jgi:serine/threonine protein kinase
MLASGTIIDDKYELADSLGAGGFGTVYRAKQLQFERQVAVKMLNTTLLQETDGVLRFEREAKAMNALKHKNIVAIYGYGGWQGAPYMVMEIVDGTSLNQMLNKDGRLEPQRAMRLMKQVFEALECAHSAGLVHRDLKPSNILVIDKGELKDSIKLIDFGLVKLMPGYGAEGQKLTETGFALGTCSYMAPEQATGLGVDNRGDIYSAGCILYEMLAGKPLFTADDNIAIMFMHIKLSPEEALSKLPDGELKRPLVEFLRNCLAKEPANRYQNCRAALTDLDQIIAGNSDRVSAINKPARKLPKRLITASAITVVVAALPFAAKFTGFDLPQNSSEKREAYRAEIAQAWHDEEQSGKHLAALTKIYETDRREHILPDADRFVLLNMLSKYWIAKSRYEKTSHPEAFAMADTMSQQAFELVTDPTKQLKEEAYRETAIYRRMVYLGHGAKVRSYMTGVILNNRKAPSLELQLYAYSFLSDWSAEEHNLPAAVEYAKSAVHISEGHNLLHFKALLGLTECLTVANEIDEAADALTRALRMNIDYSSLVRRTLEDQARIHLLRHQFKDALSELENAQKFPPRNLPDQTSLLLSISANAGLGNADEVTRLVGVEESTNAKLYQSSMLAEFDWMLALRRMLAAGYAHPYERLKLLDRERILSSG